MVGWEARILLLYITLMDFVVVVYSFGRFQCGPDCLHRVGIE